MCCCCIPPYGISHTLPDHVCTPHNAHFTYSMLLLCPCTAPDPLPPAASKSDALHTLARLVSERDKDIRQAALGALEVVYGFEGSGERLGAVVLPRLGWCLALPPCLALSPLSPCIVSN